MRSVDGSAETRSLISILLIRIHSGEVSCPSTKTDTEQETDVVFSEIGTRNVCTFPTKTSYISGDNPPVSSTSSETRKEDVFLKSPTTSLIFVYIVFIFHDRDVLFSMIVVGTIIINTSIIVSG